MRTPAPRRQAVRGASAPSMRPYRFEAPTRGWVTNIALASDTRAAASLLDNWFPEREGLRLRGGSQRHATILSPSGEPAGSVDSFIAYQSTNVAEFFAAVGDSLYDVTAPPDPNGFLEPVLTGRLSSENYAVQFATAGGEFLPVVNGADPMVVYDGSNFVTVDAATTAIAVENITDGFLVGEQVVGGSSGALGVFVRLSNGDIRLKDVVGTFTDNETLTGAQSSATAQTNTPNGAITPPFVFTGIDTAELSFVTSFKSRLFFVQRNSRVFWFLPVDQIGGQAQDFSLNGILQNGGSIEFIGTWSFDAGDGIDDRLVIFSDQGEAVVYQGTDPSNAATWSLVGRYDVSRPLGRAATLDAGGDLVVATIEGMVPISEAVQKDSAALSLSAVSRPIEPDWRDTALTRGDRPWIVSKWNERNLALVAVPTETQVTEQLGTWGTAVWGAAAWGEADPRTSLSEMPFCFIVNLETGAWTRYTGWDAQSSIVVGGQLYFGTSDGRVLAAEVSGADDGGNYTGRYASLFEDVGGAGSFKILRNARATFLAAADFNPSISVSTDYTLEWPVAPNAPTIPATGATWDAAAWDAATWDDQSERSTQTRWRSISGAGYSAAIQIQATSGAPIAPDVFLVTTDVTYEQGGFVV